MKTKIYSIICVICLLFSSSFVLSSCDSSDAVGIANAQINENGELVLIYSDGNEQNLGGVGMKSIINELWHGNIVPQEDSRNNSPEMKELMEYMARHHDDLLKTMTDEQKEIFEKFDDCWSEYMSLAEAAIFEYAFKLGMQIAIETLTDK